MCLDSRRPVVWPLALPAPAFGALLVRHVGAARLGGVKLLISLTA